MTEFVIHIHMEEWRYFIIDMVDKNDSSADKELKSSKHQAASSHKQEKVFLRVISTNVINLFNNNINSLFVNVIFKHGLTELG